MEEGHLYRLRPCGSHEQILHSINLHLFAHPCCQRLLPREAADAAETKWVLEQAGFTMPAGGAFSPGLNPTGSIN